MLVKVTSGNRITTPKKIMDQIPNTRHFDVDLKDGIVMLRPLRIHDTRLDTIRSRIKKLGIKRNTIAEAIQWARSE